MAKLNAKKRNALPGKDFAVPGRKYPINDRSHARNALARVSQFGSAKEKAEVRAKVHSKYPGMGNGGSMKKREKTTKHEGGKTMRMHHGEHEGHKAITAQTGRMCKGMDCGKK